jgi:hypothetical protein
VKLRRDKVETAPNEGAAGHEPPVPDDAPPRQDGGSATTSPGDRPEVIVGAAFLGGFAAAQILKRLGK